MCDDTMMGGTTSNEGAAEKKSNANNEQNYGKIVKETDLF
jgi:hypothetical protein